MTARHRFAKEAFDIGAFVRRPRDRSFLVRGPRSCPAGDRVQEILGAQRFFEVAADSEGDSREEVALDCYCRSGRGSGRWQRDRRSQREQTRDEDSDGDCHNSVRPYGAGFSEDGHPAGAAGFDADSDAHDDTHDDAHRDQDAHRNQDDFHADSCTSRLVGLQRR